MQNVQGQPRAWPIVSVIVVVRNGERFLAQALDSISQQSYPLDQVIVVDGQSNDGTRRIAHSRPGVELLVQDLPGLGRARNLGIQHARGEFVAFLDHDDLWMGNKLQTQVAYMCSHPAVAFTTTCFEWFVEPGSESLQHHWNRRFSDLQCAPTPSALVARRVAFEQNDLFDEELMIACDSEWFARARRRNVVSATLPHLLLRKRLHAANLSQQVTHYRREWFRVLHQLNKTKTTAL